MHLLLLPLLICASGLGAPEITLTERVDLIEVNHFHDENGRLVLDQVIFYQWAGDQHQFIVRAWRMIRSKNQFPHRSPNGQSYECLWRDDKIMRCVQAPIVRETWTQVDPERANRQYQPQEGRRDLAQRTETCVQR